MVITGWDRSHGFCVASGFDAHAMDTFLPYTVSLPPYTTLCIQNNHVFALQRLFYNNVPDIFLHDYYWKSTPLETHADDGCQTCEMMT